MKRAFAIIHDVVMAGVALSLSLVLRYGVDDLPSERSLLLALGVFMAIAAVVFRTMGLGRGMWRFASLTDIRRIVVAATLVSVGFLFLMFVINRLESIPRSVPVITWFVMIVLLSAPRIAYRAWKDGRLAAWRHLRRSGSDVEHLLLVGSVSDCDRVIRLHGLDKSPRYAIAGIIDYRRSKTGRSVRGIEVLGSLDDVDDIVRRLAERGIPVAALVVATPGAERARLRNVTAAAVRLGLPIRRLRASVAIDHPEPSLQEVTLEDLLGRPPVSLALERMRELVAGQVVVVTGAGGSIGSELVRQVAARGPSRLLLLDHTEHALYEIDLDLSVRFPEVVRVPVLGDVRDRQRIQSLFLRERPTVVFHAAALKHVPLVEANPCEGILTNVIGTQVVADAAVAAGVGKMVMISTDKAIRPVSVMGATKRAAEAYCQAVDVSGVATRFITVRFGNVLGSTGSVVPLFKRQIEAGGPVTVTHPEMRRYFMTVQEATELVLQAAATDQDAPDRRGKIFVLDMGEPVRIVDLARTMIALSGCRPGVDIEVTFSGLRPGERLFEEIFDPDEGPAGTAAEGVFVAMPRVVDLGQLRRTLTAMELAAASGDAPTARNLLADVVPGLPRAPLSGQAVA
ncbi:MAG: nucleoside-diphosphate sugar epimerase/dehydratase [Pseudomonadota bacterium]